MSSMILNDAKTAVDLFSRMRKARKVNEEVSVRVVREIPLVNCGVSFLDTVEGCCLANSRKDVREAVWKIFKGFTYEEKRMLSFSPEDGKFIMRVDFWADKLKPVLSSGQYRSAMRSILHWYVHIKKMRKAMHA